MNNWNNSLLSQIPSTSNQSNLSKQKIISIFKEDKKPIVEEPKNYSKFAKQTYIFGIDEYKDYVHELNYILGSNLDGKITNVDKPPVLPLRFTYNGKYMIATDERYVLIYNYRHIPGLGNISPADIYYKIFSPKFQVRLDDNMSYSRDYRFLKEFLLVHEDDEYVIGSMICSPTEYDHNSPAVIVQRNTESLNPVVDALDHYIFLIIDINKGIVSDRLSMDNDWIPLPYSLYMRKRTLAILSVQHQLIHVYNISKDLKFEKLMEIGEVIQPVDSLFVPNSVDTMFTEMKQLMMKELFEIHKNRGTIKEFFNDYDYYLNLKMYRFQMIDDDNILIRWAPSDTMKFERSTPHFHPAIGSAIFTFFNWKNGSIEGIYDLCSENLMEIFENANQNFRYGYLSKMIIPLSSEYATEFRKQLETMKSTMRSKNMNEYEIRMRILNQLPISMPNTTAFSPYLDLNYFTFDVNFINAIERGRVPCEPFLRTFSKLTGQAHITLTFDHYKTTQNHYCYVLFHPKDAFVLAYSKLSPETNLTIFIPAVQKPT